MPRSNLQLVSVACMLVASKHEEVRLERKGTARTRTAVFIWRVLSTPFGGSASMWCEQYGALLISTCAAQEVHPSVADFTNIADNCFAVRIA